jgi:DNA repair protein RecO (recombination protein O)
MRAGLRGRSQDYGADSMPLHTTDALILRTYKLNEADRIVVFLTRDRGKKRGVAKGARRLRSRFRGALEPLTRASIVYFEKESRELVSLNDADTERSPLAAFHPEALGYVGYLAELIDEWAPENDPNEKLFRLGAAVVEAMAADVPVEALVRYFEFWLLRLQGVYPSIHACPQCGTSLQGGAVLEPRSHWFLCRQCASHGQGVAMPGGALQFLREAALVAPSALGDVKVSTEALGQVAAAHRLLLVWHLDREPRAARVLREINP